MQQRREAVAQILETGTTVYSSTLTRLRSYRCLRNIEDEGYFGFGDKEILWFISRKSELLGSLVAQKEQRSRILILSDDIVLTKHVDGSR